ncbi:MAG: hypothetical protein FJY29_13495 [Betaproteobacteria bacterium]|nr:hypothetical protein [Betaproteobacteria bacterium]
MKSILVRSLPVSLALISSLVFAGGCKRLVDKAVPPQLPPPQTGMAEQINPQLEISLDASLNDKEREYLKEDFRFAQSLKFKPETSPYFVTAFNSRAGEGILRFLDERIGHIIGPDTTVESRFSYTANTGNASNKAVTIATNIGTAVWLETIAQRRSINFFTNNTSLPVNDPRIGIIKLGRAYSVFDENNGRPLNTVARTSILVHEARHSDCTGGLADRDFLNLASGQLPENRSCGHLHTICTSGDYEGLPACDGKQWGAYALGWLFANEIVKNCENCTAAMRATAEAVALDSLARIPQELAREMRSGSLNQPDMSSTPPTN